MPKTDAKNRALMALLIIVAAALLVLPLIMSGRSDFSGTDTKATEMVGSLDPGYRPWFKNIWEPPQEVATLIFSLQAALGAGILCYILGYYRGRRQGR